MKECFRLSKKCQVRKWKSSLKDRCCKIPCNVNSGQSITKKRRQEEKHTLLSDQERLPSHDTAKPYWFSCECPQIGYLLIILCGKYHVYLVLPGLVP